MHLSITEIRSLFVIFSRYRIIQADVPPRRVTHDIGGKGGCYVVAHLPARHHHRRAHTRAGG